MTITIDVESIEKINGLDKDKIGFKDGDNILLVHSRLEFDNITYVGQAFQNFAKTILPRTGLHKSLYLLGFSDRYLGGQLETPEFESGDIMARTDYQSISPIHFINIFETYKNLFDGKGFWANFELGIREVPYVGGDGLFDFKENEMTPEERVNRIEEKIKNYKNEKF